MSALQAFLWVGGVVLFGVLTRIGWDICGHQRRLGRMKREADAAGPQNFLGVEITPPLSAKAGTEETRIGPYALVEPCDASTDKHTGAGVSDGGHQPGSGVTAELTTKGTEGTKAERDPQRCVRCHHFHLDVDSLICHACREAMIATKGGG